MSGDMTQRRTHKLPKNCVGFYSAMEHALVFAQWAQQPNQTVSTRTIQEHWGVSRATAFRWLAAWNAVQERRAA